MHGEEPDLWTINHFYWQSFASVVLPQALGQELTVIKGSLTTQPRLHPQTLATIMQTHPVGNPRIFLDRMTLLFQMWRDP